MAEDADKGWGYNNYTSFFDKEFDNLERVTVEVEGEEVGYLYVHKKLGSEQVERLAERQRWCNGRPQVKNRESIVKKEK